MKVKEESETVGLKRNIQKTKIMASGPITSWQIDGETVETVSDFILGPLTENFSFPPGGNMQVVEAWFPEQRLNPCPSREM